MLYKKKASYCFKRIPGDFKHRQGKDSEIKRFCKCCFIAEKASEKEQQVKCQKTHAVTKPFPVNLRKQDVRSETRYPADCTHCKHHAADTQYIMASLRSSIQENQQREKNDGSRNPVIY